MEKEVLPKAWESILNSADFVPVIVKTIERFHDTSWFMEPNRHEFFEMTYMKRGSVVFEIAGEPVNMGPNDIVIIKPNQDHRFFVQSESGCEFIVLNFKFENKVNGEYSAFSLEDFLNFVKGKESGAFIKLKVSQKNEIINILNRILKERKNREIGSDFLNYLLVLELFVLISRALKMEWENSIKGRNLKIKELVEIAAAYIRNNFERNISLSDIARFVFLSPSYFARVFRQQMGVSPINYLLKVRVERAGELLKTTDKKAIDIAVSVGFSNQQRFNEIFKKYTGMTPLQYRKHSRDTSKNIKNNG